MKGTPLKGTRRERLFTFVINDSEHDALAALAASMERSMADTLRYLVRKEAKAVRQHSD